jgi:integrase
MKRSAKSDEGRARRISQHLGSYRLVDITPAVLATYRNDRLKTLAPQTVVHDLNLINRALRIATSEWGVVLPAGVPRVIKPKRPEGRDRRVADAEIEALIAGTESPELALIVGLAVETAMRRSEIVSLKKEHISLERRVAFLPTTKNDKPRRVPLSTRALSVIEQAWPLTISDTGPLLTMRADSATKAFARAVRRERKRHIEGCKRRGTAPDPHFMVDLRFHDLRHEAISRAAEKGLNVIELAAVSGHKTLSMLGRYTHLRAEDLARKLG